MSYIGNRVKIPLGEYGLLTDIAPDKVPPGSLLQAQNVCFFNGAVQKAPGAYQWNTAAVSNAIVGAHYFLPTINQPRFIALTSDGNIYKGRDRQFGSPINSTIASVLTPNCVFADGGAEVAGNARKCFIFTGGATLPYVISGDAASAYMVTQPSQDWTSTSTYPVFGLIHRSQLWAFAGQLSYASSATNHEVFNNATTSLVNPVYPGEGGQILGGFVFKGRLFCFKDGGFVYLLNDQDTNNINWYWQKVASNFGLSAPNAVDEVLNDMLAGNTYGTLTSYEATLSLGSVAAADILQQIGIESFIRGFTSKAGLPTQHIRYYPEKKMLFATYRSTYQTTNDSLLMLDFGRSGNTRAAFWTKGSPQCLALYKDSNQISRPMYGSADGHLYLMDYMDRSEGTAAYTGAFQTQHLDFSHVDQGMSALTKQFDFLAVHYVPTVNAHLSCAYYIDGRYIETIQFPLLQYAGAELDVMQLDINRMAVGSPETALMPIRGAGRTFSAHFYQSGANQSFQVPAITVYFRAGGDSAQQT